MTPRELSNKWLHRIGYKIVSPENRQRNDDLAPVLPFVVLDIYHDYFRKGLTPDKFTQRQKQLLKRAAASYSRLNKVFFSAFAPSEYEDVTDLMDSLQEYAKNQVLITEVAAWNVFKNYTECDTIVCAFMCNSLAKAALSIWRLVYRGKEVEYLDKYIQTLLYASRAFAAEFVETDKEVEDPRVVDNLLRAENSLGRRIVEWLFKESESKEESK